MKKTVLFFVSLLLLFSGCTHREKAFREVDICVYGGTSAGVIAAYTAAMDGKSVLLIEPRVNLGGMSSGGLGYTDIGNKYVVTGLARDFYRRLGQHYGKLEQWIFEPSVAESIFNDYIAKGNVEVLYSHRLHDVEKAGESIAEIVVECSQKPDVSTNKRIQAKVFIDCTYEGDLMAKAGVSYALGREANDVYNETYNGVQVMRGHQFWDPIDPYVVKGDPKSGLIWGVNANELQPTGSGDKKIQAYNFRVCLTDNPDNMIPITKPDNYDPARYELALRLHEVSPRKSVYDYFIWSRMPNGKTDINNGGGISTDMIGMNWEYPEASYERRAEIWKAHEDYTKGFFYFLGNDERVPEKFRKEMKKWGYPKDEYIGNNHWTHQLYVREARRMIGDVVMTEQHCVGKEVVDDPIAWAAYQMDSHNCDRLVINGDVKNEGNVEIDGFPPYPISYRAIVPKKGEVDNLFVPICLSASHIAYGSIRMEPVFMVLGQVAAVGACMAIDEAVTVQAVDVAQVQQELKDNPLADGSTPEIIVDNNDPEHVSITGEWVKDNDIHRSYGLDYLVDRSRGRSFKAVKYMPEIKISGKYTVYTYFPKSHEGEETAFTTISVFDGQKLVERRVREEEIKIEGQTKGEWVKIGDFHFPVGSEAYLEISNKGATGEILADAVLFLPIGK